MCRYCLLKVLLQTKRRQWHQRKGSYSIYLLYKWANTAFWQRYGRKSQLKSSKCLVYQGADNAFWLCTGRTDVKRKLMTDVCSERQTKNLETLSTSWECLRATGCAYVLSLMKSENKEMLKKCIWHSTSYSISQLLQASESDVSRRQILTTKVDPRTVRIKIFLMSADP